jgi:hypothetical protein
MRGMIFINPSPAVVAEWRATGRSRYVHGPEGKFGWALAKGIEGIEGVVFRWSIVAYDSKGRYAIQTGGEDYVEGCRSAIFVADACQLMIKSSHIRNSEEQATLLSEGVPGELFYVPGNTKFRTAWQQDYIVDYKTGWRRPAAPIWDWF